MTGLMFGWTNPRGRMSGVGGTCLSFHLCQIPLPSKCRKNASLTCLVGKGEPENARLSLVADDDTAFEHNSEMREHARLNRVN